METTKINTEEQNAAPAKKTPFVFKGLKGYAVFLTLLFGTYICFQVFGVKLFNSTSPEHEKESGAYGSSGSSEHRNHGGSHYYHK